LPHDFEGRYKNLGVRDREPLLIAIERRVAKDLTAQVPVFAPTISSQLASRVAMTHGEGDSLLYEASVALGTRELTKARMLAEEARAAFAEAGDVVLRERQPLVDNLLRYVVAEEERHEKIRRAKVKATKKSQEQAKLQQRFYILYHHKVRLWPVRSVALLQALTQHSCRRRHMRRAQTSRRKIS
jgi:hypothetical protein